MCIKLINNTHAWSYIVKKTISFNSLKFLNVMITLIMFLCNMIEPLPIGRKPFFINQSKKQAIVMLRLYFIMLVTMIVHNVMMIVYNVMMVFHYVMCVLHCVMILLRHFYYMLRRESRGGGGKKNLGRKLCQKTLSGEKNTKLKKI